MALISGGGRGKIGWRSKLAVEARYLVDIAVRGNRRDFDWDRTVSEKF
jgi:hypothetical protein